MTFRYIRKTLLIGIVLLLSMVIFVMPVFANETLLDSIVGPDRSENWYDGSNVCGTATEYSVVGPVTPTVTGGYQMGDISSEPISLTIYSPSYDPASPATNRVGGGTDLMTITLTAGTPYYLVIHIICEDIEGMDWVIGLVGAGDIVTWTASPPASPSTGAAAEVVVDDTVYPPDNRINWQFGDLGAVLYRGTDSDGNPAINVYCYDGENSSLGMQVSEANMSDGMSADGCNVTFHVLANGGYQFNIEYDGKRYEIECADFECNPPEMRYFDPNE